MVTDGQGRRRDDARSPRRLPFAPTTGGLGPPDPAGVMRSLVHALDGARRMRRPLVLVSLELPHPGAETDLARLARIARRTVRRTDALWRDGELTLALLLADVDGPGCEPALHRLRATLREERLDEVRIGRAAPAPGIAAEDLLVLAREDARPVAEIG